MANLKKITQSSHWKQMADKELCYNLDKSEEKAVRRKDYDCESISEQAGKHL
jgi:hypothetical protein